MTAPTATIFLRGGSGYGREFFAAGLTRLGYAVSHKPIRKPSPRDILVTWNRRKPDEPSALAYEAAGAKVIVAENGYIGSDENGRKLYALALGHHNGAGTWPEGDDPGRWERQNIRLEPWRTKGDFVLVLPQRGIGETGVSMPVGWPVDIQKRLGKITQRTVQLRKHPAGVGNQDPTPALKGAWCAVTHASGAGLKAIAAGVPCFYTMQKWIGAPAATLLGGSVEDPYLGDRVPMFRRLAWSQFSRDEIATGVAFEWLIRGCAKAAV